MCIYINIKLKKIKQFKINNMRKQCLSFILPKSKIKFKIYMHTLNPFELRN